MIWVQFAVVLLAIFIGARIGGIGIGYAGGIGVIVLGLLHVKPGQMPLDVVSIIMAVIAAIAAMQAAGGMDWLVHQAEKLLRKHPRQLMFLAPIVTYLMTLMAGTGHTAFSALPVITEVAKETDMKPSRPLSIAVVSSQIAITASPISAAVVWLSTEMEKKRGVGYIDILAVCIPSTFLACMIVAGLMVAWDRVRGTGRLSGDPVYEERKAAGLITVKDVTAEPPAGAGLSVLVFLIGLITVMVYATIISPKLGLVKNPIVPRDAAIISIMLTIGTIIVLVCKVDTSKILQQSTFRSGMSAAICVLGVAWLGSTFVGAHEEEIRRWSGSALQQHSWLLAVILFFAASLLYSQAATSKALIPTAVVLGMSNLSIVAAFAAVSSLFVLPTYPTLLAAVEMDDTGSTRIGKAIFNHPFLIPGVLTIAIAVALGYAFGLVIL